MARHSFAEVGTGAVVVALAVGFLAYAVGHSGAAPMAGYELRATFNSVAGLPVGSDVRIAGVRVGSVTSERIDPETYLANVTFTVAHDIRLPKDTSAAVRSEGLLGADFLALDPGGDTAMLPPGGRIMVTQSAIDIGSLLGKFIFGGAGGGAGGKGGAAAPSKTPSKTPSGGGKP
jgi:phospholipid/cholesterol/gamma-HCH transport system substrate-binding protein